MVGPRRQLTARRCRHWGTDQRHTLRDWRNARWVDPLRRVRALPVL